MIEQDGPDGLRKKESLFDWLGPVLVGMVVIAIPSYFLMSMVAESSREKAENDARVAFLQKSESFQELFSKRGTDVFYFKHNGHDCYMATAGNAVAMHCPR